MVHLISGADADTVVIGAGVVGLAVARELAVAGTRVMVLEQHSNIGAETSSRNSEVIHAGLYYPTGSLKAQCCVKGKHLLYEFCARHGVDHKRLGKLIVATDKAQLPDLVRLQAQATANGVDDLVLMDAREVHQLEPELFCEGALYSPSTGIVDSHALMMALQGSLEARGGEAVLRARVERVEQSGALFCLQMADGFQLTCRQLVVACGLYGVEVLKALAPRLKTKLPSRYYAKGNYFAHDGRVPFSHLVYPVPEPGGLGVHLTLDLGGQGRFGPDVEWLEVTSPEEIDYGVSQVRLERFYNAIRRYWPDLEAGSLRPDYTGVRPKVVPEGAPAADFQVLSPTDLGIEGLVAFAGIESPGLTAALSLAQLAADALKT